MNPEARPARGPTTFFELLGITKLPQFTAPAKHQHRRSPQQPVRSTMTENNQGRWSQSEKDLLEEAVRELGVGRWKEIAECVGTR